MVGPAARRRDCRICLPPPFLPSPASLSSFPLPPPRRRSPRGAALSSYSGGFERSAAPGSCRQPGLWDLGLGDVNDGSRRPPAVTAALGRAKGWAQCPPSPLGAMPSQPPFGAPGGNPGAPMDGFDCGKVVADCDFDLVGLISAVELPTSSGSAGRPRRQPWGAEGRVRCGKVVADCGVPSGRRALAR